MFLLIEQYRRSILMWCWEVWWCSPNDCTRLIITESSTADAINPMVPNGDWPTGLPHHNHLIPDIIVILAYSLRTYLPTECLEDHPSTITLLGRTVVQWLPHWHSGGEGLRVWSCTLTCVGHPAAVASPEVGGPTGPNLPVETMVTTSRGCACPIRDFFGAKWWNLG